MPEFSGLMKLVFLGAFLESTHALDNVDRAGKRIQVTTLTSGGVGDEFIEGVLLQCGYIVDKTSEPSGGKHIRPHFRFPGSSSRIASYEATDKLRQEIPDFQALEVQLKEKLEDGDSSQLFQLCLLLNAWNLVAYSSELLGQMGLKVSSEWSSERDLVVDFLDNYSPSEARYFLWMAQRKVAIDILAQKLAPNEAEKSLFKIALEFSSKYLESGRKATHWKWYTKQSDSPVETILKRIIRPGTDLDSQTLVEVIYGE